MLPFPLSTQMYSISPLFIYSFFVILLLSTVQPPCSSSQIRQFPLAGDTSNVYQAVSFAVNAYNDSPAQLY